MSKKIVGELLIETLIAAGVKHVFGLAGDSLNGITHCMRPNNAITWIPVRHEEVAAFAAGAEAHLTGSLAVCAGSCGPGNMHLILATEDAVFTCDVGTPTIWAARYLTMNGKRRLLGSFNHGSMANALPQAIGAQTAFPDR